MASLSNGVRGRVISGWNTRRHSFLDHRSPDSHRSKVLPSPLVSPTTDIAPSDDLTWQKGSHTFKTGVFVARNRKDQNGRPGLNAAPTTARFYSIAATRIRRATLSRTLCWGTISSIPKHPRPQRAFPFTDIEAYVADTWRLRAA